MSDVAVAASASPSPAKKTKTSGGVKKAKTANKPAHPITSVMVNKAIADLKEKGGSSLQAIKKYIAANYKVDVDRLAPFIRKYLKNAVESGALVRTKGKGASGSFKLDAKPVKGEKKPAAKKVVAKPKAGRGAPKKAPAAKKAVAAKPKKAAAKKAAPAAKKAAAKPKSPSKAKKSAKPPTKKPKSPKPKKAVSAKSRAIKKTAGKK